MTKLNRFNNNKLKIAIAIITLAGAGYLGFLALNSFFLPKGPSSKETSAEKSEIPYDYSIAKSPETGITSIVYLPKNVTDTFKDPMQSLNPALTPGYSFNYNPARFCKFPNNFTARYQDTMTVDCPKGTVVALVITPGIKEKSNFCVANNALAYLGQRLWTSERADWDHAMADGKPRVLYVSPYLSEDRKKALADGLKDQMGICGLVETVAKDPNNPLGTNRQDFFYAGRDRALFEMAKSPPVKIEAGTLAADGPNITAPITPPNIPTLPKDRYAQVRGRLNQTFEDNKNPFILEHNPEACCTYIFCNMSQQIGMALKDPYQIGSFQDSKVSDDPAFQPDATGLPGSYGRTIPSNMLAAIVYDPTVAPKSLSPDGYEPAGALAAIWKGVHVTPPSGDLRAIIPIDGAFVAYLNPKALSGLQSKQLHSYLLRAGIKPPINNTISAENNIIALLPQRPAEQVMIGKAVKKTNNALRNRHDYSP